MKFKGGLLSGTLVSIYGALIFLGLFSDNHMTLQNIFYVLGGIGVALGIYLLVVSDVTGIPVILVGLVNIGMALEAPHSSMQIALAGLAAPTLVIGALCLTKAKPAGEEGRY